MAVLRVDAVKDSRTNLYFVEIYNPSDASMPLVTTEPRYMTAAAAENDVIATIAAGVNRRNRSDGTPKET